MYKTLYNVTHRIIRHDVESKPVLKELESEVSRLLKYQRAIPENTQSITDMMRSGIELKKNVFLHHLIQSIYIPLINTETDQIEIYITELN